MLGPQFSQDASYAALNALLAHSQAGGALSVGAAVGDPVAKPGFPDPLAIHPWNDSQAPMRHRARQPYGPHRRSGSYGEDPREGDS
jgi:hypothetical protein